MSKNIIWTSEINTEDWVDFLEEEGINDHNSPEAFERINEYNWDSIGDEESNIDIDTPEEPFCGRNPGVVERNSCSCEGVERQRELNLRSH